MKLLQNVNSENSIDRSYYGKKTEVSLECDIYPALVIR